MLKFIDLLTVTPQFDQQINQNKWRTHTFSLFSTICIVNQKQYNQWFWAKNVTVNVSLSLIINLAKNNACYFASLHKKMIDGPCHRSANSTSFSQVHKITNIISLSVVKDVLHLSAIICRFFFLPLLCAGHAFRLSVEARG